MMFAKEEILPSTNPQSPFYLNLPKLDAKPVDELVLFFRNYKILIKNLLHYFREIALVKEFESNLNHQLLSSYNYHLSKTAAQSPPTSASTTPNELSKRPNLFKTKSASNHSFLKTSSNGQLVNSINSVIVNHHHTLYQTCLKNHKEIQNKLIPKLENLHKNLSAKIKEIKTSLKNDSFVNDLILREISKTGVVLKSYMQSVEVYNTSNVILDNDDEDDDTTDPLSSFKHEDPFLIKLRLNYQIKNQLIKENYLFAAFINLQNISKELLVYVLKDLAQILDRFDKNSGKNLSSNLNLNANQEWESFIANNPNFLNIYTPSSVNPKKEIRHFKDIVLPYSSSVHNKCIRFGIMYKKSKLLKNYNRYYYLLTCNFLHEFKIENPGVSPGEGTTSPQPAQDKKNKLAGFIGHNDIPVKSYNLNNYKVVIKNEKNLKFNLIKLSSGKQTSLKCKNSTEFSNWITDLTDLLRFESDNLARFEFVERKLVSRSGPKTSSSSLSLNTPTGKSDKPPALTIPIPSVLNLSISDASQPNTSLQGVFTPNIRTPSSSGSDRNPFDLSFTTFNGTSPNSNPGSNPASPGSDANSQHEHYLKVQQEYLKKQQELINLKLKETEKMKGLQSKPQSKSQPRIEIHPTPSQRHKHSSSADSISTNVNLANLQLDLGSVAPNSVDSSGNLVVRTGSNTSLVSMDSIKSGNPSKLNSFLQQNENLVPKFFVTDEDEKKE